MKNLLGTALVSMFLFTGAAQAEAPLVERLESSGAVFLADAAVAKVLLEAAEGAPSTLLVDRIVTMPPAIESAHARSNSVCVQLSWHGGDAEFRAQDLDVSKEVAHGGDDEEEEQRVRGKDVDHDGGRSRVAGSGAASRLSSSRMPGLTCGN